MSVENVGVLCINTKQSTWNCNLIKQMEWYKEKYLFGHKPKSILFGRIYINKKVKKNNNSIT